MWDLFWGLCKLRPLGGLGWTWYVGDTFYASMSDCCGTGITYWAGAASEPEASTGKSPSHAFSMCEWDGGWQRCGRCYCTIVRGNRSRNAFRLLTGRSAKEQARVVMDPMISHQSCFFFCSLSKCLIYAHKLPPLPLLLAKRIFHICIISSVAN